MPYSLPPFEQPPVVQTLPSDNTAPAIQSSNNPLASDLSGEAANPASIRPRSPGAGTAQQTSLAAAAHLSLLVGQPAPRIVSYSSKAALLGPPQSVSALPEDFNESATAPTAVLGNKSLPAKRPSLSLNAPVVVGMQPLESGHVPASTGVKTTQQRASSSVAQIAPGEMPAVRQILTAMGRTLVSSGLTAAATLDNQFSGFIPQLSNPPKLSQRAAPSSKPDEAMGEPIELNADRQEYNVDSQIFTASGNVLLRFRGAVLRADQLQVNLRNQVAAAQGNVMLTRGRQVLSGERLEYRLVQNQGTFLAARGTIYLPTATSDFSPALPTDVRPDTQPFTEQIRGNQPLQATPTESIQQLRFEAERLEFNARGWQARNIRITSDPFSPPELEVRAPRAELVQVSPREDRVMTTRPRLVLDQGLSLPLLRSQARIDRQERDPTSATVPRVGVDEGDRGGLFVGRNFNLITNEQTRLQVTPQFLLGRAFSEGDFNVVDPNLFGLNVRLGSTLGPRRSLTGFAIFNSLEPSEIVDNVRARLSLRQRVGPNTLTVESAYRDRLFNGSLGEQTVNSSVGAVLSSSAIALGNTGLNLSYQVGTQFITADTDLLGPRELTSLGRLQAATALSRGFSLWQGKALAATATEGLRYTPRPVVPYLQLVTGITGVMNAYTNGDAQGTLTGTVGLRGQLGHFSRSFFDYTGFNISYSQVGLGGLSPFLFDRVNDLKVLSAAILQQVYGPIRLGFQTSVNVETGELFNTDILLDYSRRTYGLTLRYSPTREIASFDFRINGFNWTGNTEAFGESEIRSVEGGIERVNE